MSVFYCLRTERKISLFKQRAWTCIYNVGPRSRTMALGYEVAYPTLHTRNKWRRMHGRTLLERDGDMPMFSARNSEEYKMVELCDI